MVKTLRQDQNAKLADFEEMEKYRVGFEKTSGLIEAERERNNQDRFHFLSFILYESYVAPILEDNPRTNTYQREWFKIIPKCVTQVTHFSCQVAK